MKPLSTLCFFAITGGLLYPGAAFAQSSDWMSPGKLQFQMDRAKKRGWEPTSITCRHRPTVARAVVRPEAKVTWDKPKQPRPWALWLGPTPGTSMNEIYAGQKWRLISRIRFKTGSRNTTWSCELWKG